MGISVQFVHCDEKRCLALKRRHLLTICHVLFCPFHGWWQVCCILGYVMISCEFQVLFGLLIPCERRSLAGAAYTSLAASGTQQDQHNILPLAPSQNRFQLLPVSLQTSFSTSGIQPVLQPPKVRSNTYTVDL